MHDKNICLHRECYYLLTSCTRLFDLQQWLSECNIHHWFIKIFRQFSLLNKVANDFPTLEFLGILFFRQMKFEMFFKGCFYGIFERLNIIGKTKAVLIIKLFRLNLIHTQKNL